MCEYKRKGKIERQLLEDFYKMNLDTKKYSYSFTPADGFDINDGLIHNTITNKHTIVEAKSRDNNWTSLMIQKDKFESLIALSGSSTSTIYYINFTPTSVIVFDFNHLLTLEPTWKLVECNKSTVEDKGKIEKEVWMIPITEGKMYKNINSTLDTYFKMKEDGKKF